MASQTAKLPIIVLGPPRSGTTLLRRLLDAHPNIACPGETFLLRSCGRFLRPETIAHDLDYGIAGGMAAMGVDMEDIRERLRHLVDNVHERHAEECGKPRWAEKTAVDAFYIDEIEALYGGRAQFVCMVRHGLDVVASMHDLTASCERFVAELYPYIQGTPFPDIAYARAWVDIARRLIDLVAAHQETAALLRYEDLVADPEGTLQSLFDFLEEDWDAGVITRGMGEVGQVGLGDWKSYEKKEVEQASVGRWQELSETTVNRTAPILNPTLEDLGYPPLEITSSKTPVEAMRRYQLSMMTKASQ